MEEMKFAYRRPKVYCNQHQQHNFQMIFHSQRMLSLMHFGPGKVVFISGFDGSHVAIVVNDRHGMMRLTQLENLIKYII
uniref:DUF2642 domain-containing protein n=1 Tax=Strongyloides venezuelensis TaxID=75913 RepID=A0A0K0F0C6_STRVS